MSCPQPSQQKDNQEIIQVKQELYILGENKLLN